MVDNKADCVKNATKACMAAYGWSWNKANDHVCASFALMDSFGNRPTKTLQEEIQEKLNTLDSSLVQMYVNGAPLDALLDMQRKRNEAKGAQAPVSEARAAAAVEMADEPIVPKKLFRPPHKKQVASFRRVMDQDDRKMPAEETVDLTHVDMPESEVNVATEQPKKVQKPRGEHKSRRGVLRGGGRGGAQIGGRGEKGKPKIDKGKRKQREQSESTVRQNSNVTNWSFRQHQPKSPDASVSVTDSTAATDSRRVGRPPGSGSTIESSGRKKKRTALQSLLGDSAVPREKREYIVETLDSDGETRPQPGGETEDDSDEGETFLREPLQISVRCSSSNAEEKRSEVQ